MDQRWVISPSMAVVDSVFVELLVLAAVSFLKLVPVDISFVVVVLSAPVSMIVSVVVRSLVDDAVSVVATSAAVFPDDGVACSFVESLDAEIALP